MFYSYRLSLQDSQSNLLLQLSFPLDEEDSSVFSADKKPDDLVDFNKFQESFIAVLSATADQLLSNSDNEDDQDSFVMESSVACGGYIIMNIDTNFMSGNVIYGVDL